MTSIVSGSDSSTTSSTDSTYCHTVSFFTDGDTDSGSEVSTDHSSDTHLRVDSACDKPASKRHKISAIKYKPVWIKAEPGTHHQTHVETHSVAICQEPLPEFGEFVKWDTFVRKLVLRNRNIDIYETKCVAVSIYELALHPELNHPKCTFVDTNGETFPVPEYFAELERQEPTDWNPWGRGYTNPIPEIVESSDLTVCSDVTDCNLTDVADGYIADLEFPELD